ncbi:sugar ABC transporter permease [Paenibacillus antri]|uniref:Sugar ABC transporter permease n=1 Tax=Paenibacillus antri TaxID=2582848 RepID=A0A5R9G9K6_9BACL|nr:sugar ABC transporter permease [Paenibacillus antri]TLS52421.1 sugar ABC transporter permease [Paenibacillus antri]
MRRWLHSQALWGYLFIGPAVLGLLAFVVLPVLFSLVLSFTNWDGSASISFIGLDNFARLFQDVVYLKAMRTTGIYALIAVPLTVAASILVAALLDRRIAGRNVYRTIFFIPSITMPIAIAVVWKWLYNSSTGLINFMLGLVGIDGPSWLTDPNVILWSVIIISVWAGIGSNMVILLAGLQGIPESYYEAARIDGASAVRRFLYITVPMLTPTIFFVTVTSFISSFQVFDLVYIFASSSSSGGGGVLLEATRTAVYSIYQNGFQFFKIGYASAQAWVLFLVILLITLVQLRLQKRWVHYE